MIAGHIVSRSNQWVKHLRKLGTSRKFRYEVREFVCDGVKLLEEAHLSGAEIGFVLMEQGLEHEFSWLEEYTVYTVPREIIESVAMVETPQGVVFSCKMPRPAEMRGQRFILLDHLQDTGNLGTIIRCADAFAIDGVILGGCVDPYNPKTVRAAMGALFRVPIIPNGLLETLDKLKTMGISSYAAVLADDAVSIQDVSLSRSAVVIGNEGNGVSREIWQKCDGQIILPMSGRAESLNASVAAGIIMWEMQKRQNA